MRLRSSPGLQVPVLRGQQHDRDSFARRDFKKGVTVKQEPSEASSHTGRNVPASVKGEDSNVTSASGEEWALLKECGWASVVEAISDKLFICQDAAGNHVY